MARLGRVHGQSSTPYIVYALERRPAEVERSCTHGVGANHGLPRQKHAATAAAVEGGELVAPVLVLALLTQIVQRYAIYAVGEEKNADFSSDGSLILVLGFGCVLRPKWKARTLATWSSRLQQEEATTRHVSPM